MKKAKIILSIALSALLLAPIVVPTAICTAAPTRHPNSTGKTKKVIAAQARNLILSDGHRRLGPNYLMCHNRVYADIQRLSLDMEQEQWNATMYRIITYVWRLNQIRHQYAIDDNEAMVEDIQEEIWDILLYLMDHIVISCNITHAFTYDHLILILYFASGGNITTALHNTAGEDSIAQCRITDENLIDWASRPLNPDSAQFALLALNALWYGNNIQQCPNYNTINTTLDADSMDILGMTVGDRCTVRLRFVGGRYQYIPAELEALPSRIARGEDIYYILYDTDTPGAYTNGLAPE